MAIEDTRTGARTGLTLLLGYVGTVAGEIGMDRALELDTKLCRQMGAAQGQMLKQQVGVDEVDAATASQLVSQALAGGFGIQADTLESTAERAALQVGECPVYQAAQAVGMDHEEIQAVCQAGSLPFMAAMVKQLNPQAVYRLERFRAGPNGTCQEVIEIA